MASKREQVLQGVEAFVKGALPYAKIRRNAKKPTAVDPGGNVIIFDGDPGDPEVTLSPLAYTYDHQVALSVATYPTATAEAGEALDKMLAELGQALEADRTLGGVCEWAEFHAPAPQDAEVTGAEPIRWAEVTLACTYTTPNPLA